MKKRIEKKIIKLLDKIEENEKARTIFCISFLNIVFWSGLFLASCFAELIV